MALQARSSPDRAARRNSAPRRLRAVVAADGEARQDRRPGCVGRKAQRSAISIVAASASGRSANSSRHFGAALEAMLGRELAALAVGNELALGDAEQRVVGLVILARGKERLVGGDQRNTAAVSRARSRPARRRARPPCRGAAIRYRGGRRTGAASASQRDTRKRVLPAGDGDIERPVRSAAQRDQTAGLAVEPSELQMRPLVLRRLEIGARAKPHQAAIAVFAARPAARCAANSSTDGARAHFLIAEIDRRAHSRRSAGCRSRPAFRRIRAHRTCCRCR